MRPRRMKWAGHVASIGGMKNVYNILVGKSEEKRPLGRRRSGWEDNIKMDLRRTGLQVVDWIHLAEERDQWRAVVNTVMYLWVPWSIVPYEKPIITHIVKKFHAFY
jgi:hypothetical protein